MFPRIPLEMIADPLGSAEYTLGTADIEGSSHVNARIGNRDSAVDRATDYRLDVPRTESRWGDIFRMCPDRPWGPTQPPVQWVPGIFPRNKAAGREVDQLLPSSAEEKERLELYLYPPLSPYDMLQGELVTLGSVRVIFIPPRLS